MAFLDFKRFALGRVTFHGLTKTISCEFWYDTRKTALKKLPAIVAVPSTFEATVCDFQTIDFIRLTFARSLVESDMHRNRQRTQQIRMKHSMEDATMGSIFDIFKVTSDGPLWVEAVHGLEKARERMARLALTSPGEYFIHSQEQGIVAKEGQECLEGIT
jgi:hypothetical protein